MRTEHARRGLWILLWCTLALAITPSALSEPLWRAAASVPFNFSTSPLDNAGNSTGILMASALASLEWLRRGGSAGATALIVILGIAAGAGA